MNIKHFLGTLLTFVVVILLGLFSVYLINRFDGSTNQASSTENTANVAK